MRHFNFACLSFLAVFIFHFCFDQNKPFSYCYFFIPSLLSPSFFFLPLTRTSTLCFPGCSLHSLDAPVFSPCVCSLAFSWDVMKLRRVVWLDGGQQLPLVSLSSLFLVVSSTTSCTCVRALRKVHGLYCYRHFSFMLFFFITSINDDGRSWERGVQEGEKREYRLLVKSGTCAQTSEMVKFGGKFLFSWQGREVFPNCTQGLGECARASNLRSFVAHSLRTRLGNGCCIRSMYREGVSEHVSQIFSAKRTHRTKRKKKKLMLY